MVPSLFRIYCTIDPTEELYYSSNKLQCVVSEQNFPFLLLLVSQDFYSKWPGDSVHTLHNSTGDGGDWFEEG